MLNKTRSFTVAALTLLCAGGCQAPKPKSAADPASSASTTEKVDHYTATAEQPFESGYPTKAASAALSQELFFQRAVQTYLWALPAVNMYAMKEGLGKVAGEGYQVMSVFEKRLKPNTLITTPNSDVIYGLAFADLSKTGPLVLDAPPKLQALMDDFWHRPLVGPELNGIQYLGDIGLPGPDKGQGGKYLIVPEGYTGKVDTKQYYVYKSPTNGVFIFLRGFFQSLEDLSPGVNAVEAIKIYPLEGQKQEMKFPHLSDVTANALFAHDFSYFEMLDRLIQSETNDPVDPYMHGVLASLGIQKGSAFQPTSEQKRLLGQAAKTAWKMAKNIAAEYDREEHALWWSDRKWVAHTKTELGDFMHTLLDEQWRDRKTGYTDVDAKAHMYINHYSVSTGMISSIVGLGAKYTNAYKDSDGNYLRGENTYKLELPKNPPAKLFWSLTIYEAETASGYDAPGQIYPSLNSMNQLDYDADGSITFYVGPKALEGKKNFIKTVPGKNWFGLIRWYGPTQDFFDRKYKPGDFVKLE